MELTGGDFPQAKQFRCFVITRKELDDKENITFFNGDIESLITDLKKEKGKNIYCDGGSQIVNLLLEKDLIDEFIISVIPIMLGDGIRLFEGGLNGISLKALPSKYFDTGLVQLHYERIREN